MEVKPLVSILCSTPVKKPEILSIDFERKAHRSDPPFVFRWIRSKSILQIRKQYFWQDRNTGMEGKGPLGLPSTE